MSHSIKEYRELWLSPAGRNAPESERREKEYRFWQWAAEQRAAVPAAARGGVEGPWSLAHEYLRFLVNRDPATITSVYLSHAVDWLGLAHSGAWIEDDLFNRLLDRYHGDWEEMFLEKEELVLLQRHQEGKAPDIDPMVLEGLQSKSWLGWCLRQRMNRFLSSMDAKACDFLENFSYRGVHWLIQACGKMEELGLQDADRKDPLVASRLKALAAMAGSEIDEDELDAKARRTLEKFEARTLTLLAEHCADEEIGDELKKMAKTRPAATSKELSALREHLSEGLMETNKDESFGRHPESGGFDAGLLRAIIAAVPEKELAWFRRAGGNDDALMVLDAVEGANTKKLEGAIKRHGQLALKVYSLLPLPEEAGARDAEVRRRYVQIEEFRKGSKKFGTERQENNRIACEVALGNLALHAGYSDADDLFFDIESRAAATANPALEVDGYRVSLSFDAAGPTMIAEKDGKALKAVPAGLKKSAAFKELKADHDFMNEQGRRFRRALELRMAEGVAIERRYFDTLWRAPLLRGLVASLVFSNADGRHGMPAADGESLVAANGAVIPIGDGPLKISHPLDLDQRGELEDWRRHCFDAGIVQAVKQVFREFYRLTPAEEASSPASLRFAGQRLATRSLGGLMKTRGWSERGIDGPEPRKLFKAHGIVAEFRLEECGHYLTETDTVLSGPLSFRRKGKTGADLDLREVSATVFSEAMRDLDLFVSVAQTTGDGIASAELMEQRLALLKGLVGKLKLKGVSLEGHHVLIQGEKGSYRIHLASGAVHMGKGGHLCIVPAASWKKPDKLFLPFLDEADRKVAEIFSKILMLANDSKISDPLILAQMKAAE